MDLDIIYRSAGKNTTRKVKVYPTAIEQIVVHRRQNPRLPSTDTAAQPPGWILTHKPTTSSLGELFVYRTRGQALEAVKLIAEADLSWDFDLTKVPPLAKHHSVVRAAFEKLTA